MVFKNAVCTQITVPNGVLNYIQYICIYIYRAQEAAAPNMRYITRLHILAIKWSVQSCHAVCILINNPIRGRYKTQPQNTGGKPSCINTNIAYWEVWLKQFKTQKSNNFTLSGIRSIPHLWEKLLAELSPKTDIYKTTNPNVSVAEFLYLHGPAAGCEVKGVE